MMIKTESLSATKDWAAKILAEIKPYEKRATVVALAGDLGAGKTSFVQGLAAALGVIETVASPTFVIEKIYDLLAGQKFKRLIHIDAYRLAGGAELAKLGFADILADPANLIVIEWPERIADILPSEAKTIHFDFIDENTRAISYGR